MTSVSESPVVQTEAAAVMAPRRFQFSLRALLLLMLVASCFCGWVMSERRHIENRRIALEQKGEFLYGEVGSLDPQPKWNRWLFGNDVRYARGFGIRSQRMNESTLKYMGELTGVQWLSLSLQNVSDTWWNHVSQMKSLESLSLSDCFIDDAGMARLTNLPKLDSVSLVRCHIFDKGIIRHVTDDSVVYLKQLRELKSLELSGTKITDQGEAELRRALPQCNIYLEKPIPLPLR